MDSLDSSPPSYVCNLANLSPELLDLVLDQLVLSVRARQGPSAAFNTLHSCSLVCAALRPLAQRRLFLSLHLGTPLDRNRILEIVRNAPHLASFVQSLCIHSTLIHAAGSDGWIDHYDELTEIFRALSPLRSVALVGLWIFEPIEPFFASVLADVAARFVDVTDLTLHNCGLLVEHALVSILRFFPNVETLKISEGTSASFAAHSTHLDALSITAPFDSNTVSLARIRHLIIDTNYGDLPQQLMSLFPRQCLRVLNTFYISPGQSRGLGLLETQGASLRDIEIRIADGSGWQGVVAYIKDNCPKIQKISLTFGYLVMFSVHRLRSALCATLKISTVRDVTFTFMHYNDSVVPVLDIASMLLIDVPSPKVFRLIFRPDLPLQPLFDYLHAQGSLETGVRWPRWVEENPGDQEPTVEVRWMAYTYDLTYSVAGAFSRRVHLEIQLEQDQDLYRRLVFSLT